jgi:hypothetical protein
MPFFITAARSLRNGGITASAKSRTSCKAKAACHDQHSTSYLHTIATRPIGRQLFHLRQQPHSAQSAPKGVRAAKLRLVGPARKPDFRSTEEINNLRTPPKFGKMGIKHAEFRGEHEAAGIYRSYWRRGSIAVYGQRAAGRTDAANRLANAVSQQRQSGSAGAHLGVPSGSSEWVGPPTAIYMLSIGGVPAIPIPFGKLQWNWPRCPLMSSLQLPLRR